MKSTNAYILATKPQRAFVAHPTQRGMWLLTDACVVFVPCPQCKSPSGFPCTGHGGHYRAGTHFLRRDEYQARKTRFEVERVAAITLLPEQQAALAAMCCRDEEEHP